MPEPFRRIRRGIGFGEAICRFALDRSRLKHEGLQIRLGRADHRQRDGSRDAEVRDRMHRRPQRRQCGGCGAHSRSSARSSAIDGARPTHGRRGPSNSPHPRTVGEPATSAVLMSPARNARPPASRFRAARTTSVNSDQLTSVVGQAGSRDGFSRSVCVAVSATFRRARNRMRCSSSESRESSVDFLCMNHVERRELQAR